MYITYRFKDSGQVVWVGYRSLLEGWGRVFISEGSQNSSALLSNSGSLSIHRPYDLLHEYLYFAMIGLVLMLYKKDKIRDVSQF